MLSTRLSTLAFLAAAWCWTYAAEQRYDVACPGVNSNLQCPAGQVIEVLSVEYGDISDANCRARNQPAEVTKSTCINPALLPGVKLICENRIHCRLPAPFVKMLTCDYIPDSTFIQITYSCKDRIPGMKTAITCEGDEAKISCENGTLRILEAGFGRFDSHTCTDTPSVMTFCVSTTAPDEVKKMCDSKQECVVQVNKDVLGTPHPCDRLDKYLAVDYVCE